MHPTSAESDPKRGTDNVLFGLDSIRKPIKDKNNHTEADAADNMSKVFKDKAN